VIIGALGAVVRVVHPLGLPESPRWRHKEVDSTQSGPEILARCERTSRAESGPALATAPGGGAVTAQPGRRRRPRF